MRRCVPSANVCEMHVPGTRYVQHISIEQYNTYVPLVYQSNIYNDRRKSTSARFSFRGVLNVTQADIKIPSLLR